MPWPTHAWVQKPKWWPGGRKGGRAFSRRERKGDDPFLQDQKEGKELGEETVWLFVNPEFMVDKKRKKESASQTNRKKKKINNGKRKGEKRERKESY